MTMKLEKTHKRTHIIVQFYSTKLYPYDKFLLKFLINLKY